MTESHLQYSVTDRVACIRFNRPQAFNAMNFSMLGDISALLKEIHDDNGVRAVVMTGNGRAFSAGADLVETLAQPPRDTQGRIDLGYALDTYYNPIVRQMQALPQPVIAAVNGVAAGGAASLALAADITVAARSATFVEAFVNVGLVPDAGGSWLLPQLVGRQRAMGLTLLGETVTAEQAQRMGLIWAWTEDVDLLPTAMRIARKLADGPRASIAGIKKALHAASSNTLEQQLALESELQRECGRAPDFEEGMRAFVEKRKPVFAS
ncbi:enoyl-CoA hydratase-related protein [Solimonas soli]|uniref:enoyl-CoA hydratase-related protein n=1 Tax=Solimonas soli TaxID=413479 RepID=UPI0005BDF485|nr:enoyl-CoA hydratase-related protein [Solimonas soli]